MINAQSIVDQLGKDQLVSRATVLDLALELARLQQPAAVVGQEPFAYTYHSISGERDWRFASARRQAEWGWTETALYTAAIPAAGVQGDADLVKRLTHERDALGQAIADAALKAGMYNGEVPLSGPHLIMFAQHLGEAATPQSDSGRDAALEEAAKVMDAALTQASYNDDSRAQGCYANAARLIRALAAHPANGAQAGLSNALGDVIKGEIRSAYTEGYGHGKADGDRTASRFVPGNVVAECWTTILAKGAQE